jgi:hypothetical protein
MYSTRKNVKYINRKRSNNKSNKSNKRKRSNKKSNKSIKRSNRSNKKSNKKSNKSIKRSNKSIKRSIKRKRSSIKRSNKKNITLKQKGGGEKEDLNIILTNIINITAPKVNVEIEEGKTSIAKEAINFGTLDTFIKEVFLPQFTTEKLTTDKFIEQYEKNKDNLYHNKKIDNIKEFYNLYTKYHKELTDTDLTGLNIESLTQAETGKIMILEDRVIKFILNMDESREGAQKKLKKGRGQKGGGQKGGAYKSIEMKDTFLKIKELLIKQKDKVLRPFSTSKDFKIVPLSITRILNNDNNIENLYDIRRDFIFDKYDIKNKKRYILRKGNVSGVRNKVIKETKEAIDDDSKLRHTINIDIEQINPFYDLLCPLIDIHLLYNKKGEINNETPNCFARKILNKTTTIDDDLGSKFLPITKEVNDYFGGYIHPYFSTSNIINEDCGFNEVIVNRIIRKYLENKNYLQDKLIEIKDFSLGFIESEKSHVKLKETLNKFVEEENEGEIKEENEGDIEEENEGENEEENEEKNEGEIEGEIEGEGKNKVDYGCKYTLIDMEKCGVKINFVKETDTDPKNIKTVNNLSDLMIESLNYINNSNIDDTEKPTKIKGFLTIVIEKLLFGYKSLNTDETVGFEYNIITNINLIIKEIFKNSEKINILQIIDNLKELEYTLPANYNDYSFFGLLLELRDKLGFIHGDLKTGNVFIKYSYSENFGELNFNINNTVDYGILDMIECIVADLDKARLQVPMDTMNDLFKTTVEE